MRARQTFATAMRVIVQLLHDRRTLALLMLVPPMLLTLLRYVFEDERLFSNLAPTLLGIFPLIMMFLITSIATLRERTSGTLDRLMTLPLSKFDIVIGYMLAFSAVALVQVGIASLVLFGFFDVNITGDIAVVLVTAILSALLGTAAGLFASAFAKSEFQAIQFMPAFIFPQLLTCGLFIPRDKMADFLQIFSDFMPLSYCVEATKEAVGAAGWSEALSGNVLLVTLFILGFLALSILSIKRLD